MEQGECVICYLKPQGMMLECTKHHITCGSCLQHQLLGLCDTKKDSEKITLHCVNCSEQLNIGEFLRFLTIEEGDRLFSKTLKKISPTFLKPNEKLFLCSFCNFYAFIGPKDGKWLFLRCRYDKCPEYLKTYCTVCNKLCNKVNEGQEQIGWEEECKENFSIPLEKTSRKWHVRCHKLRKIKEEFEDIIIQGSSSACPHCQDKCRKDEKCTRMTCPKCESKWCYVCERKLLPPYNACSFGCPTNLEYLHLKDPTFPPNKWAALQEYHKQKTLFLLQKKIEKEEQTQKDRLISLLSHFGEELILNGNSLSTIKNFVLNPLFEDTFQEKTSL